MSDYEQAVFISYAWGGEREDIVNEIDETLQQRGIRIVRDKRALGYRGSIKEFMERIGRGSCIIVVISDKYLRSPNCMFELVEIAENKQFHDRIFPVVLSDANIYDPLKRIEYIKFWEGKRKELAKAMKTLDPANLHGIREEMDQYDRIRDKISGITSILKDMNTLTPDMHRDSEFSNLYDAIVERLKESSTDVTTEFDEMAKKAEVERKAKEAERLAQQKAEEDRLAKVEADSKAKEEADRLAAKKAEEERAAKAKAEKEQKDKAAAAQKAEADRKAKEEADRLAAKKAEEERAAKAQKAIPVEPKAMPVAVAPVTKKPASKRLIYGVGAVALLVIIGIAFSVLSNGGNKNTQISTPTTQAIVEVSKTTDAPATEVPATPTTALASTATIAPTPIGGGSGKIVFAADSDIYTINVDGTGETRLTDIDSNYDPVWSPDGKKIAFVSERDGKPYIYLMNSDGSRQTRLTNNSSDEDYPAWSPDGQYIAFSFGRFSSNINTVNSDGSNMRGISYLEDYEAEPAWSPDGQYIAFRYWSDGSNWIYRMNVDGSGLVRLTDRGARNPSWSPDSKYIAFAKYNDSNSNYEIYTMKADGSEQIPLTDNSSYSDSDPVWSPDGKYIAFKSTRDGELGLYLMRSDGSDVTLITKMLSVDWGSFGMDWQP